MSDTTGRQFETGAYRDTEEGKLDFEGFLSPAVLERYARYMDSNRKQSNGDLRSGDNWQAGIPKEVYMRSMFRHFFDVWKNHRELPTVEDKEEALCALMFNVMGYLFEELREEQVQQVMPLSTMGACTQCKYSSVEHDMAPCTMCTEVTPKFVPAFQEGSS